MKSSILIVSYLWKDTWSRWREQPSSLLARLSVGLLLALVATVILAAFNLMEQALRARLESFGLNTLVVRQMLTQADPSLTLYSEAPDPLKRLAEAGRKLRLRQLFLRATTEFNSELPVLSYSNHDLPLLVQLGLPDAPFVCFSDSIPPGTEIQARLVHQRVRAVVAPLHPFFRRVGLDSFLLLPQGWAGEAERVGYMDTTIFEKTDPRLSVRQCVEAVRLVYQLDRHPPPQIQSALSWIHELDLLETRQKQWRFVLAGVLGSVVALVFGAIAWLEFRQNLFITGLLRSLGAPSHLLYLRQWLENAFLANLAAGTAVALVAFLHGPIFTTLGFASSSPGLSAGNPCLSKEILLIFLWINLGALLSSLPVAFGLKRPVGKILN